MPQIELARLGEERDVARIGARESALDVVDAELVEPLDDEQLVGDGEAEPSPCVPSRSVVS